MARKLVKFVILFDNTNVLYFPGQFLSGRVIVELNDDTPALGEFFCFVGLEINISRKVLLSTLKL